MSSGPIRSFNNLTLHALSCGLAAIVPIPFVDDLLKRRLRRNWVRQITLQHGVELDDLSVDHIAGIRHLQGWTRALTFVYNLTVKLAFKLVRRIFRNIFFFLAIKDAADAASDAFHRGYLEELAVARLETDTSSTRPASEQQLIATGWAIDRACKETDTRAVQRTLKGAYGSSRSFLRSVSRRWSWTRRKASAEDLEQQTDQVASAEVVDEMARELAATGYLDTLDKRCRQLVEYWSQAEFHRRHRPSSPGDSTGNSTGSEP